MDIHQILKQLPHRYPILLVDRVLEIEKGVRIKALKNVSINEPYFVGHFPHHPVMPGVLILEAWPKPLRCSPLMHWAARPMINRSITLQALMAHALKDLWSQGIN